MTLSYRAFAGLARVSHQAITRAVREGRVVAGRGGIDPSHEINRDYLALRGSAAIRRLPNRPMDAPHVGTPLSDLEARCRQVGAKLALAQQRLREVRDAYHDRREAIRVITTDAAVFVREFRALPKAYGPVLAERCGVPADVADTVLEKLVTTLLDEFGDLKAEARNLVETA
jgi:hypothetical protein